MLRMAHLQILSSQINSDPFQNRWLQFILRRFVALTAPAKSLSKIRLFLNFMLKVLYNVKGVGRLGLPT